MNRTMIQTIIIHKCYICILILFLLNISFDSCKKEEQLICGVEKPEENLPWLNSILQDLLAIEAYRVFYNNTEYIILTEENTTDDGITSVYDCSGNLICTTGGLFPGNQTCSLPSEFWQTYLRDRELIFCKAICENKR